MLSTYAAAGLIVAASLLVGQALCRLGGAKGWPPYAGAVGLAALFALASLGNALPGDFWLAVAVVGVAVLTAAVWLVRAGLRGIERPRADVFVLLLLLILAISLAFLASGRTGLPGISLNNDTAVHLLWSEGLRSHRMAHLYPLSGGYPIGPHALIAVVAQATGLQMDHVLTGLLIALPMLTGVAALSGLDGLGAIWRLIGGLVVGVAYLPLSYFAQGAFKELCQGLFVLGFALVGREARRGRLPIGRAAVPLGVLAAGCLYAYSYIGLAWIAAGTALWALLEAGAALAVHRSLRAGFSEMITGARRAAPLAVSALIGLLVVAGPAAARTLRYLNQVGTSVSGGGAIAKTDLGNLAGPISPWEALGAWPAYDFRFHPSNELVTALLAGIALGAVIYGGVWWLRRRDLALPAAAGACVLLWLLARRDQSPYVVAKALAIAAPVVALLAVRAVLEGRPGARLADVARATLASVFVGAAVASAIYALRGTPVGPQATQRELASLRPLIGRSDTLFLGMDDFVGWKLRGVPVGYVPSGGSFPAPRQVVLRPEKRWQYGQPLDIDSVEPADVDRFRYVLAPRTSYASAMPHNLRRVASTRSFELWKRTGPTPRRQVLERGGAPGGRLDCTTSAGRRLAARGGRAAVMPTPAVVKPPGALLPGGRAEVGLPLRRGRWALSLEYTSALPLTVEAGGRRFRMAARLDRPGPFWAIGDVQARRGLEVSIASDRPSFLTGRNQVAFLSALAATPVGEHESVVPLRAACGHYVDWYRTTTR